jgi:hypothetical protein
MKSKPRKTPQPTEVKNPENPIDEILTSFQLGTQEFIRGLSYRDGFVSLQADAVIAMAARILELERAILDYRSVLKNRP